MVVAAVAVIMVEVMAVAVAVIMVAAVVVAPRKGSGENLKKSFLWKKGGFLSGFLMQKGV